MRPTRLTPEVADTIVEAVEKGLPLRAAAGVAGIAERTFFEWLARGEGTSPRPRRDIYAQFAQRVRQAEAKAMFTYVQAICEAAVDRRNADVALKFLRLRWPSDFAERREITGPAGSPVLLQLASVVEGMSDDDLRRVLATLQRALAEDEQTASMTATEPRRRPI